MAVDFNLYERSTFGNKRNQCDVIGDDIGEIVEAVVQRIRPKSGA